IFLVPTEWRTICTPSPEAVQNAKSELPKHDQPTRRVLHFDLRALLNWEEAFKNVPRNDGAQELPERSPEPESKHPETDRRKLKTAVEVASLQLAASLK